jgi:hypothetical protein
LCLTGMIKSKLLGAFKADTGMFENRKFENLAMEVYDI